MELEKDNFISIKRLSSNVDFYNNVFKRAERVASVIFYILSFIDENNKTEVHKKNLSDKSMKLHEAALASLNLHEYEAKEGLYDLTQALVAMESTLSLAVSARIVRPDVKQVVDEEIDVVMRYIKNHYLKDEDLLPAMSTSNASGPAQLKSKRERKVRVPAGDISSGASAAYQNTPDRTERIKTVLSAKPEATIKDISMVITDCSEKTIQRELNSLIDTGEVIRQGERRWSKYSLVS